MSTSNSASGIIVPDGQYPPWAVVTDTDHRAWIIIATAFGLSVTLLFGCLRGFVRSTVCPGLGLDDAFIAAATLFTFIQSAVILGACSNGFGESIDLIPSADQAKVQHMYYVGTILFLIAHGLSKLSITFFILRLTVNTRHKQLFYAAAGLMVAWIVGSVFAVALRCDLGHPWITMGENCPGELLRWQIICAFDIVTEVCLACMPITLVWGLYSPMKKKVEVVITFSFRLLIFIPIAFRLATFNEAGRNLDPTLGDDLFSVWTQAELNYSLVSATIPCLRSFINNLNTQFGGLGEGETSYGYGYGKDSSNNAKTNGTYQMSNLKSNVGSSSQNGNEEGVNQAQKIFVGKSKGYRYDIQVPNTGGDTDTNQTYGKKSTLKPGQAREQSISEDATSVESHDSQQLIIRKGISFQVNIETNDTSPR